MRCLKPMAAVAITVKASSLPVLAQDRMLDWPGQPEMQDATRAKGYLYPPIFRVNQIDKNFVNYAFSSVQPGVIQLSESPR